MPALYLNPEQLILEPVTYSPQVPALSWRYELTDYGNKRLNDLDRAIAQDWRTGSLHAATIIGGGFLFLLGLAAYAAGQFDLFWEYLYWPVGLFAAGVAAAYLHASTAYPAPLPFPVAYTLSLRADPLQKSGRPAYFLGLRCDPPAAPPGHALHDNQDGFLGLGPLDKLRSFEVRSPQPGQRDTRHLLIANFTYDENTPRESHILATWAEGALEPIKPTTPLHQLRELLQLTLIENREKWLKPVIDVPVAPAHGPIPSIT